MDTNRKIYALGYKRAQLLTVLTDLLNRKRQIPNEDIKRNEDALLSREGLDCLYRGVEYLVRTKQLKSFHYDNGSMIFTVTTDI